MDDIRNWFNTKKNYAEGVKLYLKYGKDPVLIRLFTEEKQTLFKETKLASALEAMLLKTPRQDKVIISGKASKSNPAPQVNIESANKRRWPELCDEILDALKIKWREKYSEMMNLQARIGDIARAGLTDPNKKEEAGRIALRILDLDDECDAIYAQKDFYLEHKKLPDESPPVEISLDPSLWYKKLHNHQRYVRQFRKDLKKDPGNIEKAELLQKHEWAVREYKKKLKMEDMPA